MDNDKIRIIYTDNTEMSKLISVYHYLKASPKNAISTNKLHNKK